MANVPPRPPHRRSKPALIASGFGISLHLGPWGSLHWSTEEGFQRERAEARVRRYGVLTASRYMPPEAADQVVPAPPSPVHTYDGPKTAQMTWDQGPNAGSSEPLLAFTLPGRYRRPLLPVTEAETTRWMEEARDQLQPRPTDAAVSSALRSLNP